MRNISKMRYLAHFVYIFFFRTTAAIILNTHLKLENHYHTLIWKLHIKINGNARIKK